MIRITQNNNFRAIIEKDSREDRWWSDCSDGALLKFLGKQNEEIDHIQFKDGTHIASELFVYFKQKTS